MQATGTTGVNITATISNFGTIIAQETDGGGGILLGGNGTITNGSVTKETALIQGYTGISIFSRPGTVTNFGTIKSTSPIAGTGGAGIILSAGGSVINKAGATIIANRNAISTHGRADYGY